MGVLKKMNVMNQEDSEWYKETASWFNKYLPEPSRLSRSKKSHAQPVALSWFKDNAEEYIAKARLVADLLEKYGFVVDMLTTDRPGYVVYEDEYQIVAVPYVDTPA
ncbi:MAG: hypothetical protein QM709_11940 [Spongiibacteraceae bacterium]